MESRPAPDPAKLLQYWMEWEKGETPPGRTLSNLKTHGLRDLLEQLIRCRGLTAPASRPAHRCPHEAARRPSRGPRRGRRAGPRRGRTCPTGSG